MRLNQQVFRKCINTILTSNCLSQIYQHNFPTYIRLNQQVSHKFINTMFLTYIRLNQQVSHKFINTIFLTYIRLNQQVSHKFSNTIFPAYILLNQQVTISQKSFHNRLNNESFTHMQKKLKYLLRRRPSPPQGREGNRLNRQLHIRETIKFIYKEDNIV